MQVIPVLILMIVVLAATRWSDDFDKASTAMSSGQYEQAAILYTKALQTGDLSDVNRSRAYNNRAVALDRQGRFSEALQDFDMALRMKPNDIELVRNRGATYAKAQSAMAAQNVSVRLSPAEGPRVLEKARAFGFL